MAQRPTLPEALDFDEGDLAANRAGRLSEPQRGRLAAQRRRSIRLGVVLIVAVGAVAVLVLYAAFRSQSAVLQLVGIGVTVCNAALTGVLGRTWLRLGADLREGAVRAVRGPVRHTIRVTGRAATYVVHVGGEELALAKPVFLALEENRSYRLYRAAVSGTLLSAEDDVPGAR